MRTIIWTFAAISLEFIWPSLGMLLFFLVVLSSIDDLLARPLSLFLLYLSANYAFGSLLFHGNLIQLDKAGYVFQSISTRGPHIVLLLFMSILLYYSPKIQITAVNIAKRGRLARFIALILLVITALVGFDASLIGGSGDIRIVPFMLFSIIFLSDNNGRTRFVLRAILIMILASTFAFESKREFAFLVYLMLILYRVMFGRIKIGLIKLLGFLSLSIVVIMAFTIFRGYGAYKLTSIADLFMSIRDLFESEMSWEFLAGILEIKGSYFYTVYPIASIMNDSFIEWSIMSIIKPIYIVPGFFGINRPDSFSTMFTAWYDRDFWIHGGSLPPGLIAEYFFIFRYLGVVFAGIIVIVSCKLMTKMINVKGVLVNTGIFALSFFIFFLRGSGLDLFLIYCGLFYFFSMIDELVKVVFRRIDKTYV